MVEKAKWKPLELPLLRKTVNQKPYHIPGGIAEISATITELKDAGVAIPTVSSFTSPVWLVQKTDGSWRVTVDYHQFNQGVTPIAAAVPDVVSFLEQIDIPLVPGMQLLVLQRPFCLYKNYKCSPERVCFQLARLAIHLSCLTQGYITSPAQCHSLACRDLDCLSPPQDITLVHYIDHIILTGPSE